MDNIPQDGEKPQSSFSSAHDIALRFCYSFDRAERDAILDELNALSTYLRKQLPLPTVIAEVWPRSEGSPFSDGARHIVLASDWRLDIVRGVRKEGDALCRRISKHFRPRVFKNETREASCVPCLMIAARIVNAIEAAAEAAEREAAE